MNVVALSLSTAVNAWDDLSISLPGTYKHYKHCSIISRAMQNIKDRTEYRREIFLYSSSFSGLAEQY
jgi:hypothetical protein